MAGEGQGLCRGALEAREEKRERKRKKERKESFFPSRESKFKKKVEFSFFTFHSTTARSPSLQSE